MNCTRKVLSRGFIVYYKTGEEIKEGEQGRMTILGYLHPFPVICHAVR